MPGSVQVSFGLGGRFHQSKAALPNSFGVIVVTCLKADENAAIDDFG